MTSMAMMNITNYTAQTAQTAEVLLSLLCLCVCRVRVLAETQRSQPLDDDNISPMIYVVVIYAICVLKSLRVW